MAKKEQYTNKEYVGILRSILSKIENGEPLEADDSDDYGCKYTHCNWGFCHRKKEHSKVFSPTQKCPLYVRKKSGSGCFFHCYIFRGRDGHYQKHATKKQKERIVSRIHELIAEHSEKENHNDTDR